MTERTFEILDHTADKGVAAEGRTMAEAFEAAAFGMFSLFIDPARYRLTDQRRIEVEADDREQLLWKWLSEVHYIFEVENVLPLDFSVEEITDTRLTATVSVRRIDSDIEWFGSVVKAVTFHQLKVEETAGKWRIQVYVDV